MPCQWHNATIAANGNPMHGDKKHRRATSYIIFYLARCAYVAGLLVYLLWLIPPLLVLILRQLLQLPSISCILFDVLLFSNGLLGSHDRNIAPCGIICRGARGATVFSVCRKWNSREWWGWFVLRFYLILVDNEEHPHDLDMLL